MEANGGHIPIFDDLYHGFDYLEAVACGDITPDDMVLMFSIDGAQSYQMKVSLGQHMDCCRSFPRPVIQEKHVFLATFIPGPNKLKHPDSYLFPGLYHLAALQKEGLMIWDAAEDRLFRSYPYLLLAIADGPGMTYLNGVVGHLGVYGCRLYCPTKGCHKPNTGIYYPALSLPLDYTVTGCNHPDINVHHIPPVSMDEYSQNLAHVMRSCNET
jgi:hypothetical protein